MADPVVDTGRFAGPAGFFRRGTATFADAFAGMLGAFLILSLMGLSIPMDSPQMGRFTRPLIFCGFLYVGLGPWLLPNSLGKYAFAVRVVSDRTGGKPAFLQFLIRAGALFFWPVELLVLLFSPANKRVGDRLARTSVMVEADAKRTWAKRIGITLTALFVFYLILIQTMQAAARNTEMFQAVVTYLNDRQAGVERLGAPVQYEKTPLQVLMRQEKGHLILGAAGSREKGYVELSLIRESGRWQVEKWEVNRTPSGRGFSYSH